MGKPIRKCWEDYQEKASSAARAERFENFKQAHDLWKLAEKLAPTVKQEQWCKNRAEVCSRWGGRYGK